MVDWREIRQRRVRDRLESVFQTFENSFGVTKLLDSQGEFLIGDFDRWGTVGVKVGKGERGLGSQGLEREILTVKVGKRTLTTHPRKSLNSNTTNHENLFKSS
jgi:hypothetical protein